MDGLAEGLDAHRNLLYPVLRRYESAQKPFLLKSEIWDGFEELARELEPAALEPGSFIRRFMGASQEAVVEPPFVTFAVRPRVADWHYVRVHVEELEPVVVTPSEYLQTKEHVIRRDSQNWRLEIDLEPFNRDFPRLKERRSIGRGVEYLNRHLSGQLFVDLGKGDQRLLEFLQVHEYRGTKLMLNTRIRDLPGLRRAITTAIETLSAVDPKTPWDELHDDLQTLGFEPGWGDTAASVMENLDLLGDILEAPSPSSLETFLGRVPMIFTLAVLSPHGFFGQSGVLGLPDTGGQIVYILDQVRALEKEMRARLAAQGLDIAPQIVIVTRLIPESRGTTCDQPLEPVAGTENVHILRVPFRDPEGRIVPHWISRFKVWPYLERFTEEVEVEMLAHLGGRPDLVVGNYSDGNLVASLLSRRLEVTQCNIAHALEKTKYLMSDIFWRENEEQYHFACQFTADLISMNAADFIITSTYQEIAGTDSSVGQYESYRSFTMPDLYRVIDGIDPFDPRFNIVSPGSDPDVYFPRHETQRRLTGLHDEIERLVFRDEGRADIRGQLARPELPIIFSMARLDRIKNLAGLVDWYGRHPELRQLANLVLVAGKVDPGQSTDPEELDQMHRMHELFDEFGLDDCVRWIGVSVEKNLSGELYRWVADRRGVFVQPALFEAFGLTVIEAMISGLPTFATRYGGPLEIIVDGVSGFHVDPGHGEQAAEKLAAFFRRCLEEPTHWDEISAAGIARVRQRYTWERYAERMMTLARVYGFWKYVSNLERQETRRYLEMFYSLQLRPLAQAVPL